MKNDNFTNKPALAVGVVAYKHTHNLCILAGANGEYTLETTVEVHDFLPPNVVVADTTFTHDAVKQFFEEQLMGNKIGYYYQDGIEYPRYEINMDRLNDLSTFGYADYLSIRAERPHYSLPKEYLDERVLKSFLEIADKKRMRAKKLAQNNQQIMQEIREKPFVYTF